MKAAFDTTSPINNNKLNKLNKSTKKHHSTDLIDTGVLHVDTSDGHVSCHQLANKLKQIKLNLDSSNYLNDSTYSVQKVLPTSLNNTFSIFSMTSPSFSANTSSNFEADRQEKYRNHTTPKTSSINTTQQFMESLSPSPIYSTHTRQLDSRLTNTPDSMSQVYNMNLKKFEFEVDNCNKSSIDFILGQIQVKNVESFNTSKVSECKKNSNATKAKRLSKISNDKTNLVSLRQTSFIDNVSRQSSIRSLISNDFIKPVKAKKSKTLPQIDCENMPCKMIDFTNSKNSNESEVETISSNVMVQSQQRSEVNIENKRVKDIKFKDSALSKNEIDLLNDWDTFKSDEAAYDNSSILSQTDNSQSNSYENEKRNEFSRPDTRLAFNNNDESSTTTSQNDLTENITVRSSNSSQKFYQDVSECISDDCSMLISPRNGPFEIYQSDKNELRPDSQQSVLSNFISNLNFDNINNNGQFKVSKDDINPDLDYEEMSELFPDETISILNHHTAPVYSKQTNEKKMSNHSFSNLNFSKTTRRPVDTTNSKRGENYQRLSHSINDLFANLLSQIETQKNKNYLNTSKLNITRQSNEYQNLDRTITDESLLDLNEKIQKDHNGTTNTGNLNKKQNLSKDSNKDSGFNQEFITNSEFRNKYYANSKSQRPDDGNRSTTYHEYENEMNLDILKCNTNEISLLERYLNNEQVIAYKHSQLEAYLTKVYSISFASDFAMLDYIQTQEGLSKTTFKKLIREKFRNFEWTNEVLMKIHEIINQQTEVVIDIDDDLDCGFNDDFDTIDSENRCPIDRTHIEHSIKTNSLQNETSSPSSSSSVSFRKLKDIKSSSNSGKKKKNETRQGTAKVSKKSPSPPKNLNKEQVAQNNLRDNLTNSFVKRRQRKGSLPEIRITENNLNESTLIFNNGNTKNETVLTDMPNDSTTSVRSKAQSLAAHKRISRKSAFVLDPMRTSMFRSKSLTDLNNSLVRSEKPVASVKDLNALGVVEHAHNLTMNNNSIIENFNSTFNLSKFTDSAFNHQVMENCYSGVIWQCADMIYDNFKNKYQELQWLMNGDNISTKTKLKEISQRLKIETTLREKNGILYEKLISEGNDTNFEVKNRLKNQLIFIDQKIKDLELIRLFLRICEINSHGMDSENLEVFFNNAMNLEHIKDKEQQHNLLQGKSNDELLKLLYGCNAACDGFIYQFFVIYRYMFSSIELLEFFKENFVKALYIYHKQNLKELPILDRTIDLIAMWIDGFYVIDFQQNEILFDLINNFIANEIKAYDQSKSNILSNLLQNPKLEFDLFANKKNLNVKAKSKSALKRIDADARKFSKNLNGTLKKRIFNQTKNIRSKSSENLNNSADTSMSLNSFKKANFFVGDYPVDKIANQLTLIEWDNFLDIHVCHCLNSKAQGVNCDSKQPIDPNNVNSDLCLFVDNYLCKSLYKMIQFNYLLTHWVAAEVLMVDNLKLQGALIVTFLKIAKKCYDLSNFSTSFSIYDGLQDISVRNLRSWQYVGSKHVAVMEKIASCKLLFQNEPFLINHLVKTTNKPVIPCMHLFLLIVQQNEHGSFQLANGQWKWSKLSCLANLVDQIRVIQQHFVYDFEPCDDFVEELLQRIYYFKDSDLNQLAEYNSPNFYGSQKLNTTTSTIKNLITSKKRFNNI